MRDGAHLRRALLLDGLGARLVRRPLARRRMVRTAPSPFISVLLCFLLLAAPLVLAVVAGETQARMLGMCRLLYGVAQVPSMLREWGWGKAKEEVRPNTPAHQGPNGCGWLRRAAFACVGGGRFARQLGELCQTFPLSHFQETLASDMVGFPQPRAES